jgi:hypothetical protein
MKCTELFKSNILNNVQISKEEFEDLIFIDVILFSWKLIDFQHDFINWIKNQTNSVKSLIEKSVLRFSKELIGSSTLTKTGMKNILNYLQCILNLVNSKSKLIEKYLSV